MGKKLVTQKNWVGIYVNPDVVHPRDSMDEHTFTYYIANKYCHYHNIPVKYQTVNYNPTPTSHPSFQGLMKQKGQTTLNSVDIAALKNIQFGIGMSRGGAHMWLFSKGYVYEVHWDEVPSLYEKKAIEDFPWLSNIIIVPPDGALTISVAACACAATP